MGGNCVAAEGVLKKRKIEGGKQFEERKGSEVEVSNQQNTLGIP